MSLTDMWKAADSPKNQNPFEWARGAGAGFIDNLAKNLNTLLSAHLPGIILEFLPLC